MDIHGAAAKGMFDQLMDEHRNWCLLHHLCVKVSPHTLSSVAGDWNFIVIIFLSLKSLRFAFPTTVRSLQRMRDLLCDRETGCNSAPVK